MKIDQHVLHLGLCCRDDTGSELIAYLRQALPFYRSLSGLNIRLLRSADRASRFLEVVEYESLQSFQADQIRVAEDKDMKALLAQWRALLSEPPVVEHYIDITRDMLIGVENGSGSRRLR